MNQAFPHEPVMATEVVGLFAPVPSGLILDATVGGGGHAAALLTAHGGVSVLGLDRDPAAAAAATAALAPFGQRATVRQSRFDHLAQVVSEVQGDLGTGPLAHGLSGVLFDLGVSSPQLDVAERGFSYRRDAALDMRMDPTSGPDRRRHRQRVRRRLPGRACSPRTVKAASPAASPGPSSQLGP